MILITKEKREKFREIVKVPHKLKAWIMLISVHFLDRFFFVARI
jgi:hypothetical protein